VVKVLPVSKTVFWSLRRSIELKAYMQNYRVDYQPNVGSKRTGVHEFTRQGVRFCVLYMKNTCSTED
jgi:hypothetical protein